MTYTSHNNTQTIYKIYKYAYDKGVNVALNEAEESKRYKSFKKEVEKAIFEQIVYILTEKNYFDTFMLVVQKSESFLETQIKSILAYVALDKMVDFKSFLTWAGERGGQAFVDKMEVQATFGLTNKNVIKYFDDYSKLLISSVDDYTKRWLAKEIQAGLKEGLSPSQIQDAITKKARDFSKIRAERIVLTETATAMVTVEVESMVRSGINEYIWRTSLDERVCPICGPLEGQQFKVRTGRKPPGHVSCRCYLEEVIPQNWISANIWLGA